MPLGQKWPRGFLWDIAMPLFNITPSVTSISIGGGQFDANPDGTFELPETPEIMAALKDHGMTVEKVEAPKRGRPPKTDAE